MQLRGEVPVINVRRLLETTEVLNQNLDQARLAGFGSHRRRQGNMVDVRQASNAMLAARPSCLYPASLMLAGALYSRFSIS